MATKTIFFRTQTQDMLTLCAKFYMLKVKKDHMKKVLPLFYRFFFFWTVIWMDWKYFTDFFFYFILILLRMLLLSTDKKLKEKSTLNSLTHTQWHILLLFILLCYRFATVFFTCVSLHRQWNLYGQFFELPIYVQYRSLYFAWFGSI